MVFKFIPNMVESILLTFSDVRYENDLSSASDNSYGVDRIHVNDDSFYKNNNDNDDWQRRDDDDWSRAIAFGNAEYGPLGAYLPPNYGDDWHHHDSFGGSSSFDRW